MYSPFTSDRIWATRRAHSRCGNFGRSRTQIVFHLSNDWGVFFSVFFSLPFFLSDLDLACFVRSHWMIRTNNQWQHCPLVRPCNPFGWLNLPPTKTCLLTFWTEHLMYSQRHSYYRRTQKMKCRNHRDGLARRMVNLPWTAHWPRVSNATDVYVLDLSGRSSSSRECVCVELEGSPMPPASWQFTTFIRVHSVSRNSGDMPTMNEQYCWVS